MKMTYSNALAILFLSITIGLTKVADSQVSTGYLYGITWTGGQNGYGTMFRYDLSANTEQVLVNFDSSAGLYPIGNLVQDNVTGQIFGTTLQGGKFNDGVLFKYNPATGSDSTVNEFNGLNGKWPQQGSMAQYKGNFYGMTNVGGTKGFGVLYRVNPLTGKDSTLVNFDTANGMENSPMGCSLAMYPGNGLFYGMTYNGGSNQLGTLFSFDPKTGKDMVLVNLDKDKGTNPVEGSLTFNKTDGLFYGVTSNGGEYNNGVLFSFNPVTAKYTVLVQFNLLNGSNPYGGLLMDTLDGLLYGMTYVGGTSDDGVIYSFNPSLGVQQVLVNFNDTTNGNGPVGNLVLGPNGKLYGETMWDATGNGVLFCYDPATATDSVIFTFNYTNGSEPYGSLLYVPSPTATNPSSVNEVTRNQKIKIYPNPSNGVFNLAISNEQLGMKGNVEIYNMLGEKIFSEPVIRNFQFVIDISNQPAGIYIYHVLSEDGKLAIQGKLVKE